jgi:hypothetical protein
VRHSSKKIQIIDFGPFDPKRTLPLLFTWGDLCAKERNLNAEIPTVEFRILGEDPGILPNPHAHYGIPKDFISLHADRNDSSVTDCIAEVSHKFYHNCFEYGGFLLNLQSKGLRFEASWLYLDFSLTSHKVRTLSL